MRNDVTRKHNQYRVQQTAGAKLEDHSEAMFKEAMSLVMLNRSDDAIDCLELLASRQGTRWPLVAQCYLWMLYLDEDRWSEADAVYESLSSRQRDFESLATLLPDSLRKKISSRYANLTQAENLLGFNEQQLQAVKRGIEIQRLLEGRTSLGSHFALLRGCRALGRQVAPSMSPRSFFGTRGFSNFKPKIAFG